MRSNLCYDNGSDNRAATSAGQSLPTNSFHSTSNFYQIYVFGSDKGRAYPGNAPMCPIPLRHAPSHVASKSVKKSFYYSILRESRDKNYENTAKSTTNFLHALLAT